MKEKIKKIMITTFCSMTAGTVIGCANTDSKIAKKINNGVNEFVSSINKLDYVDTNTSSSNLGKIVSAVNDTSYFNKLAKTTNIENTITSPEERTDNFKLYILSETPYISLTSSDNSLNLSLQFSTEKIETTSEDINEKINKLILKRAILMIYVNEIYSGNVELSEENKSAINAYVNVIKENASFLNGNRGMVKNQLGIASSLIESEANNNLVNYYIIKSGEALEIRSNKIDSTISSIESIISILEQNLKPSSCYYQNSLTTKYDNMISDITSNNSSDENVELAKSIAESINMLNTNSDNSQETTQTKSINNTKHNLINDKSNKYITRNTTRQNNNNPSTMQNNTSSTINQNTINNRNNNVVNNTPNEEQNQNNENIIHTPTTLEEKTQNNAEISKNQSNNIRLDENNNLTPSQRARIRRQERMNRLTNKDNQNPTSNTNQNETQNYISNDNYNNNKTIRANRTPNQNTADNRQTINSAQTTNTHNHNNNVVRVPYKTTSI